MLAGFLCQHAILASYRVFVYVDHLVEVQCGLFTPAGFPCSGSSVNTYSAVCSYVASL